MSVCMKYCMAILLFVNYSCLAQPNWEADVMLGVSGYRGDLIKKNLTFRFLRPAASVNLRYNIDNMWILRAGFTWGQVSANDKYNKQADLKARNLNFKSNIAELSLCLEYNLLEPEIFYSYPYLFGGVGLFHFDPYSFDDNNNKVYLRPLSTEGQGLPDYPQKQTYSNTQFCIPFGAGWKFQLNEKCDIVYELGYRMLFTDYLDDVSTTYVDPARLLVARGSKAVEMAYRAELPFPQSEGDQRGNPKVNDWYFFHGFKLIFRFIQ